ncbi:cytochrome D1 domain-containing protein [Pseudalkalibacillus decolorationis]|uniref:YVTN family beta-propeller repeat protein n=1 Tax=Pseudalkalibacillus decolorationis TaxID=163879 RepID=UPI0021482D13|nr:beta-propeller fold lactonase family protein [Pseudalkalibacillus decolorationis]
MKKQKLFLVSFMILVFVFVSACSGANGEINKTSGDNAEEKTDQSGDRAGATEASSKDTVLSGKNAMVYVNNRDANSIQVIDPNTNEVISTIEVGEKPTYNEVGPGGKYVYVVNSKSEDVSIIDTKTHKVIKTIPVGKTPKGVNFTPDGKWVFIVNEGGHTVTVIDVKSMKKEAEIEVGEFPHNGVASPDSSQFFVTNTGSNTVSVIDTSTLKVTKTIEGVERAPHNINITPDGKTLLVSLTQKNAVGVIDLDKGKMVATIPVGTGHHVVVVTPNGEYAYVANIGSDFVSVIDISEREEIKHIKVGKGPHGITVTPNGEKVYTAVSGENKVAVIDTSTNEVIKNIETENFPFFMSTIEGYEMKGSDKKQTATKDSHNYHKTKDENKNESETNQKTVITESSLLEKGQKYTYTFKEEGTYEVYCDPHPFMKMTVIVNPEPKEQKDYEVKIENYSFKPETMNVSAGSTVTWINSDNVQHSIVLNK